jgi:hypothetical protein
MDQGSDGQTKRSLHRNADDDRSPNDFNVDVRKALERRERLREREGKKKSKRKNTESEGESGERARDGPVVVNG